MQQTIKRIWIVITFLAVVDAIGMCLQGMGITIPALLIIVTPVALMLGLAWFYRTIRRNKRIEAMAHVSAATLLFMSVSAILSYLAATLHAPLIDPALVQADHAIGLDWQTMYAWVSERPTLHKLMKIIYISLIPEIFILQFVLTAQGNAARAWELLWLFIWVAVGCIIASGIWPAQGAFGYFNIVPQESYVHEFMALRGGTLKIIGSHGGMQGIVQFPSLHMAMALIFPYAVRGRPILFPLIAIFNFLIILTTPPIGGHHFADLWGGTLLTIIIVLLFRLRRSPKTEMPA